MNKKQKACNFILNYGILNLIKNIWYIIVFISLSIYLIFNFTNLKTVNIYDEFTIEIILFLIWILFLIIPFFKSFEIFGVKMSSEAKRKDTEKKAEDAFSKSINVHVQNDIQATNTNLLVELDEIINSTKGDGK